VIACELRNAGRRLGGNEGPPSAIPPYSEHSQFPKLGAVGVDVGGEELRLFERGEVPTAVLHAVMHEVVTSFGPDPGCL
jgi:hypothetical protein